MSYTVAVRTLCEFTAKSGDLDLRFTPSPTAREGIAGHAVVSGRRSAGYLSEVSLRGEYRDLVVRGRADGYDPVANRLEEIKTFRGDLDRMPENHRALHWAQAKIYGCLLCRERGLNSIELVLVYFEINSQKETALRLMYSARELELFFEAQCEAFLQWARQEVAHREARDEALEALQFPHKNFRKGQRALAESVYRAASAGRCLLAEAPTGIGKTLGTVFPLLKALPRQGIDKIFFLSAKTPGRQLALDAVDTLAVKPLRTLELIAREKSCEHPDKACHGDSCPLANGFYDRLPAARAVAAQETVLRRERLRTIALDHDICPYYLSQEMARWSDMVVGDYNYWFNLGATLHALTIANQWRVALLVDEAHNLIDRARAMHSAELDQVQLRTVRKHLAAPLKRPFDKVNREWNALNRAVGDATYQVQPDLPRKLVSALQIATGAINDYLAEDPAGLDGETLQFYFDALHFLRVTELFDDDTFVFDIARPKTGRGRGGSRLCLRNLIPARLLQPRFECAYSSILFSATLSPAHYFLDVLGLPRTCVRASLPSPFAAGQLKLRVAASVSTRFRDRAASLQPIAELIVRQHAARPGNYLAFFSSYEYLNQVLEKVSRLAPDLPVWAQSRRMDEGAREAFLARFTTDAKGVGFAVLGGAFGEGIDLPGERLVGAFIATLGLPQINPVNELLKQRMAALFRDGYNYAYLYPGLSKVIQAAGRVIRTEQDRGVVHLMDDRFGEPRVRRLLPEWWDLEVEEDQKNQTDRLESSTRP